MKGIMSGKGSDQIMNIVYHGHSCVQISEGGRSIIIDPFLTGNPVAVSKPQDIRVDAVLLTHAHADHITDAMPIATANDAPIVATFELANYMSWQGAKTVEVNLGGTADLGFARVKFVHAFHSSGIVLDQERGIVYAGMPGGYVIRWDGKTLYHAGDTGLFSDMKMIGELHDIDVAFLPIGDLYTMGPEDAVRAAEWLRAKQVVPIHYNTFPGIRQDGEAFVQMLSRKGIGGRALKPGESMEL